MTSGLVISGSILPEYQTVLTADALDFLAATAAQFAHRVPQLLSARTERQRRIDAGEMPDFLPSTRAVREGNWKIAGIPADLQDRKPVLTRINTTPRATPITLTSVRVGRWRRLAKIRLSICIYGYLFSGLSRSVSGNFSEFSRTKAVGGKSAKLNSTLSARKSSCAEYLS